MSDKEKNDKSFTLFVTYVLYNWGNNSIEFTIVANVAITIGIIRNIILYLHKKIGVLNEQRCNMKKVLVNE
jgi:hypothetical protein